MQFIGKGVIKTKQLLIVITVLLMINPFESAYASEGTAKSYCVMNADTGEIVFEKNSGVRMPMASTTKIMTLIAAIENSTPEEIVTVREEATRVEGSSAYLKPCAKITMNDLLYGMVLNSGNDAADTVAYHISGSVEEFAELMNDTAKKIGAENTHFENPSGLGSDGHFTTASELAKITAYGLKNSYFRQVVSTQTYRGRMVLEDGSVWDTDYTNHNRLLRELDGCIGVKTGYTKAAGRCLVSAVSRDECEYIIVTLNDSDDWNTHKTLCEKAFKEQKRKVIIKKGDTVKKMVLGSEECSLVAAEDFAVFTNGNCENGFEVNAVLPNHIDFPINKGEKVGFAEIKSGNVLVGKVDIVAKKDFYATGETEVRKSFRFVLDTVMRNIL